MIPLDRNMNLELEKLPELRVLPSLDQRNMPLDPTTAVTKADLTMSRARLPTRQLLGIINDVCSMTDTIQLAFQYDKIIWNVTFNRIYTGLKKHGHGLRSQCFRLSPILGLYISMRIYNSHQPDHPQSYHIAFMPNPGSGISR